MGEHDGPAEDAADAPLQPMPDVSDLKTYDVPDPIGGRGSFLRACGVSIVGLVTALGFLHAERGPHYFWVFENDRWDWNRERAQEFISELPAAEVLERVLAIEEDAKRGAFHKVLAEHGDEAQAPAIVAYIKGLDGYGYRLDDNVEGAVKSLQTFRPELWSEGLFAIVTDDDVPEGVRDTVTEELDALPPELLQKPVLAIEDPVKRGRWHKVLATTKDPAQIDAIFAYVEAEAASTDRRFEDEAQSLLAFGEAGTDKLKAALHSESRTTINLAAEALRDVNLPFLIKYCREQLDAYANGIFGEGGLREAYLIIEAYKRQNELGATVKPEERVSASSNAQAEAVKLKFAKLSFRIMEMLKAMKPVPNNEGVDFCFVHGLSSYSPPVAEYCAGTLQERLTPDKLIDVLFSYIAKKDQFDVREVDVYENMLRATGPKGGERIIENLARLLGEKRGDPSEVFWIYKKMAYTVLGETGKQSAIPVLQKYLSDQNSYYETETSGLTGQTTRKEITFTSHCQRTINAIKSSGR